MQEILTKICETTSLKCLIELSINNVGATALIGNHASNFKVTPENEIGKTIYHSISPALQNAFQDSIGKALIDMTNDDYLRGRPHWISDILALPNYAHLKETEYFSLLLEEHVDFIICPTYFRSRTGRTLWSFGQNKEQFKDVFIWQIQMISQQILVRYCVVVNLLRKKTALTNREVSVLELLALGKTNPEIAMILDIKPTTVASYVKVIYLKLGTSDRVSTALRALSMNIL